ncbi:hypothetical protein BJF79_07930 [Actinomadura sp. CNU-125]|nr:hypothetical protein BJF79_07930 [Actinomadura sp. CNU-125]
MRGGSAAEFGRRESGQVDRFVCDGPAGADAGQEQEIGDDRFEAVGVAEGGGDDGGEVVVVGVHGGVFEVGAQPGDGGAQFVGGVGGELALAGDGLLEAVEGGVGGAGELGDLVVAGRLGDAAGQVGGGDLGELGADGLDGAEGAADDAPGHPRGEGGEGEDAQEEDAFEEAGGEVRGQWFGGVDDGRVGGGADPDGFDDGAVAARPGAAAFGVVADAHVAGGPECAHRETVRSRKVGV